jgi:hypothetical protein
MNAVNKNLLNSEKPVLQAQLILKPIEEDHLPHYYKMISQYRGLSLTQIRRAKKEMWMYGCDNCRDNIISFWCYLNAHSTAYESTDKWCQWIAVNGPTPDGIDLYEEYPEIRSKIYEKGLLKIPLDSDEVNHPLYQLELISKDRNGRKMRTRDAPSLNAFPVFNRAKESKMWLCRLPPPSEENIAKHYLLVKNFIEKYGPRNLPEIDALAATSYGSNWYYDSGRKRRDYEKPTSYRGPFEYQWFWTSPATKREVWLPNKGYKMWSTLLHEMTYPILGNTEYCVTNQNLSELRKRLHKRFTTAKKIDLKGFGLQYPREYILNTVKALREVYNIEEDYESALWTIFDELEVEYEDLTKEHPMRGVGLGYFTNLMVIGVAAILDKYNVIQMFSDDILIDTKDYDNAIASLESFDFIINEKKSGKEWLKTPFFAGACLAPKGTLRFWEAQSQFASCFKQRYHYIRKNILANTALPNKHKVLLRYTRVFGYEYKKNEIIQHPNMLGANLSAPNQIGYVKGGLLRKRKTPTDDNDMESLYMSLSYPWKETQDYNFNKERKDFIKRTKDITVDTMIDEYLRPKYEEPNLFNRALDSFLGNYMLPKWADYQMIFNHHLTSGRTTHSLDKKTALKAFSEYPLSRDPISTMVHGGYEITTHIYKYLIPDEFNRLLWSELRHVENMGVNTFRKRNTIKPNVVPTFDISKIEIIDMDQLEEETTIDFSKLHNPYDIKPQDNSDYYDTDGNLIFESSPREGDDDEIDYEAYLDDIGVNAIDDDSDHYEFIIEESENPNSYLDWEE